jgi:hypothetical protein
MGGSQRRERAQVLGRSIAPESKRRALPQPEYVDGGGMKKLSRDTVIARIKAIHGKSVVMVGEFKNTKTKTQFNCDKGHRWEATTNKVMHRGDGCPHCAGSAALSPATIVARIKAVHGKSVVMVGEFKDTRTKTQFKCDKGHRWETTTGNVINSGTGCRRCAGLTLLSRADVDAQIKAVHGDRVVLVGRFRNVRTKTQFKCDKGHRWEACTPDVIHRQSGCPHCAGVAPLTRADVVDRIKAIHGDRVVLVGEYKNAFAKTQFKCDKGHCWETKTASVINNETGCRRCADHGFNPSLPGVLYYLKVTAPRGVYYKIGITNRSVQDRFNHPADRQRIEVVKQWSYENGEDALRRERAILKRHHAARYTGKPILQSGNTELFTRDVLGLDKGSQAGPAPKTAPAGSGPANDNEIKGLAA